MHEDSSFHWLRFRSEILALSFYNGDYISFFLLLVGLNCVRSLFPRFLASWAMRKGVLFDLSRCCPHNVDPHVLLSLEAELLPLVVDTGMLFMPRFVLG